MDVGREAASSLQKDDFSGDDSEESEWESSREEEATDEGDTDYEAEDPLQQHDRIAEAAAREAYEPVSVAVDMDQDPSEHGTLK